MWDEKKVRIVDIAEELGLSTATVSYVLHGKTERISDQTVKRVQAALTERGYIPNMAATLLAQNNSRIIGVVVNDHPKYEGRVLEDPFVSGALNALSDEIESAGYFLMLKKAAEIQELIAFASMWNLDGMILLGFCADEYQQLRDKIRIPFVVYDGFFDNGGNICNLTLDDRDGGRQAGVFFRSSGRTRALFIADNQELPDLDRFRGFCAGLETQADQLIVPMRKEDRIRFYHERIDTIKRYNACFTASDYYAAEFMYIAMEAGIRVPEDIMVIGFDDSSLCRIVKPELSSIRQDVALRAEKAVQYLLQLKENHQFSVTEQLPVSLVLRESCGISSQQEQRDLR